MTVKREYTCNLCRDRIDMRDGAGVGVVFEGRGKVKFRMLMDAENHLCSPCVEAIRGELASLDEMGNALRQVEREVAAELCQTDKQ